MRLTKLMRGLDGFADDKWVSSHGRGLPVVPPCRLLLSFSSTLCDATLRRWEIG
jgi:hypothetical protein